MNSITDVLVRLAISRYARNLAAVLLSVSAMIAACTSPATAATFTALQSFGPAGPADPRARLTQGPDGNFYGTTNSDSTVSCGTVYKITPAGVLSTVHQFVCTDGSNPTAALTLGADGNFYGVASTGSGAGNGSGEIFKVSPGGTFSIVYAFVSATDGGFPTSAVLLASDGNFYGVTAGGGTNGLGTVYKLTPAGVFSVIYAFSSADGANFGAGLVQTPDGNFYGTSGGNCGATLCATAGNVYRMTTTGTFTNVYEFTDGADGGVPSGALAVGTDGNLYGTTNAVLGSAGNGTIFRITSAGALTTLHTFTGTDGNVPVGGLVQASDGNFYGVTKNGGTGCSNGVCGTVFSISSAGAFTSVYDFTAGVDGKYPAAGLLLATNGTMYGTASSSGQWDVGSVFTVSLASTPPAAPLAPTGLLATAGHAQIALTWSAASGATSYNIYDGTSVGGESSTALMTGITGTAYTATGLTNGTAYYFKVASVNANGTSGLSNEASATPTAPAAPLPGQVTGLTATAGAGQVELSWTAPTNATAYTVKSGTTSGGETSLTTGVTATTYTATGLTNGTTYYFTVIATDSTGPGLASNEASATPSAGTVATPSISPAGGTYTAAQTVTLSDATTGSIVYYTTDGSTPTTSSTVYDGSISVTASETVKAMAAATGYQSSTVASAVFTIEAAPVENAPTTLSGRVGGGALGLREILALVALLLMRGFSRRRLTRVLALLPLVVVAFASSRVSAGELSFDFSSTYVGLRAGTSEYATSASDLDHAFAAAGFGGTSASLDRHRTIGGLYAGVPFYGPLSLELGYVELGRYPVTITTLSTHYAGVAQTALDSLRPAGRGATLGLGAPIDMGRWFALDPHVALLVSQSKQEVATPVGTFTDNRHDIGVAAGLAILFRPTRHLSLGGGVDCWGAGLHCDVLGYTGELEYHFGSAR